MKRTYLLLTSLMVIGLSLGQINPTSAAIRDKGTTWWSVEEMLDFYQEVEQEKLDECGDDLDCQVEFGYNMVEKGPKYSALNNFLEAQIWVTAINPSKETVKVFYFDDDMMLKRMGVEEKIHLQHLYMGWFDEWNGQIYNYNHERFMSGNVAGLHTMYDGSSRVDGPDWLPAWEEVELSVAGSSLVDNNSGIIDYAVFAEHNMFNAQGTFNYSDCLKAPDYEEGKECRLMFSGDQWATYLPPREQIVEDVDDSGQEGDPDLGSGENSDLDSSEPQSEVDETYTPEISEVESNPTETTSDDSVDPESGISEAAGTIEEDQYIDEVPGITEVDPHTLSEIVETDSSQEGIPDIETTTPDTASPINAGALEASAEVLPTTSVFADNVNGDNLRTQELYVSQQLPKAPNTGKSMSVAGRDANLMPWWLIMMEVLGGILMLWWFIPVRTMKKKDRLKNRRKSPKKLLKTLDKKSRVR